MFQFFSDIYNWARIKYFKEYKYEFLRDVALQSQEWEADYLEKLLVRNYGSVDSAVYFSFTFTPDEQKQYIIAHLDQGFSKATYKILIKNGLSPNSLVSKWELLKNKEGEDSPHKTKYLKLAFELGASKSIDVGSADIETLSVLLDLGLDPEELFESLLKGRYTLSYFDISKFIMVLEHGVSPDSFDKVFEMEYISYLILEVSIESWEKLLSLGINASKTLEFILGAETYFNSHAIHLIDLFLEHGADANILSDKIDKIFHLHSSNEEQNTAYSRVLKSAVNAGVNFDKVLEKFSNDYWCSQKINGYPVEIWQLIMDNLDSTKFLNSILKRISCFESDEKLVSLIKLAHETGADINSIGDVPRNAAVCKSLLEGGYNPDTLYPQIYNGYWNNEFDDEILELVLSFGVSDKVVESTLSDRNFRGDSYFTLAKLHIEKGGAVEFFLSRVSKKFSWKLGELLLVAEEAFKSGIEYSFQKLEQDLNIEILGLLIKYSQNPSLVLKQVLLNKFINSSFGNNKHVLQVLETAEEKKIIKEALGEIDDTARLSFLKSLDNHSWESEYYKIVEILIRNGFDPNILIENIEDLAPDNSLCSLMIEKGVSINKIFEIKPSYALGSFRYLLKFLKQGFDLISGSNLKLQELDITIIENFAEEVQGLDINLILKLLINADIEGASVEIQKKLMKAAIGNGADINACLDKIDLELYGYLGIPFEKSRLLINLGGNVEKVINITNFYDRNDAEIIEYIKFLENYDDKFKYNLLKRIGYKPEAFEFLLKNFAQLTQEEEFLLIKNFIHPGASLEIIDCILEYGTDYSAISLLYHAYDHYDFSIFLKILDKLQKYHIDEQRFIEIARANGNSFQDIEYKIECLNFFKDGLTLSKLESDILNPEVTNYNIKDFLHSKNTNSYGYSFLHLAMISKKYDLAKDLILNGFDLLKESSAGVTPLFIFAHSHGYYSGLLDVIAKKVSSFDIINSKGESLVDHMIMYEETRAYAIEKTNDPLFYFYKSNTELLIPSKESNMIHIGISHGEGLWSSGMSATARQIMKNHPNVKFHLVLKDWVETPGFVEQFDGFINPGAGDTFPKSLTEFTKSDWNIETRSDLEILYQYILDKTLELNIPYFGICAGAQNLALYHESSLKSVSSGYLSGQHEILLNKKSLPYFLTLSHQEQKAAVETCEMPEVIFKGDTAHHYAAIADELDRKINLGATSEDETIAMAYAHENGIRFGVQFHPEHYYNSKTEGGIRQHQMLENFVSICQQYHNSKLEGEILAPHLTYPLIRERLEECADNPDGYSQYNSDFESGYVDLL